MQSFQEFNNKKVKLDSRFGKVYTISQNGMF